MGWSDRKEFAELLGKTLSEVDVDRERDEIRFTCDDGTRFRMHHIGDCCESVTIDDVCGDWADVLHSPVTLAEESTNSENDPPGWEGDTKYRDSFTWTFYRLGTAKGMVTLRWYGESNGYYSESVDFEQVVA